MTHGRPVPVLSYRHRPALRQPQIFLYTPTPTGCPAGSVSCPNLSAMSDNAAEHNPTQDDVRQLVSRALAQLSPRRPLSISVGQLNPDQLAQVCKALDVDPRPVVQLSIIATRQGPQLVVWADE